MTRGGQAADIVETARLLADAARPITLEHFRTVALPTDNKSSDGFDPVTVADRDCEARLRELLEQHRPDDAIRGEEFGVKEGNSGVTWVIDPIDGTRGYMSGTPTWGVLIAARDASGLIYGIIDQPFTRERFEGGQGIAQYTGPTNTSPLKTRDGVGLSEAVLFTTFPEVGSAVEGQAFAEVASRAKLTRYGMDCYAYALLALGQIDLVIEAGLQEYDILAPIAVIEAAGGIVTDWQGGSALGGGRVVAAGSAELHAEALAILKSVVKE
ncbi:inositol monophosphatase family protein [Qingshengfaniella alkalisoli]|uniref:Inositol monophosphatase family protein n=2 Tax=Qingshengfaniella alkalisoli TaxID=2599296 RepID=A0A5B8J7C4_9RHOB|nr:inositol monophosphatase family protein [Qingshengfaniella alkalisoli]QDY70250.1 inositol monophosphatase family protein [Qingshengfaniella alkalisoli]